MTKNAQGFLAALKQEIAKPVYTKVPVNPEPDQPQGPQGITFAVSDAMVQNAVAEQGNFEYIVHEDVNENGKSFLAEVERDDNNAVTAVHFYVPSGYGIKSFKHADINQRIEKNLDSWSIKRGNSVEWEQVNVDGQRTCRWLTPSTDMIKEAAKSEVPVALVASLDYEYDRTASIPICGMKERTGGKAVPCNIVSCQAGCTFYEPDESDFASYVAVYSDGTKQEINVRRVRTGYGAPEYFYNVGPTAAINRLDPDMIDNEEQYVLDRVNDLVAIYALANEIEIVSVEPVLTYEEEKNSYVEYVASLATVAE